jgi:(E)-4-hydroxy-3-methylbut-2-enyl-diphosphate synthase
MAKTKTAAVERTVAQIRRLAAAGCEIIRVAVKDEADARAIAAIKRQIRIPLVADIHFDWRLAIRAVDSGADKIRLNPGNIFKSKQVREVVAAARQARIPIRVGLNSGSVRGAGDPVRRMVDSALAYTRAIERMNFDNLVVSLKASDAAGTVRAYREFSRHTSYPLHLGVTATGLPAEGVIKSSVAIGALLLDGIGDTIRISLTDTPEKEIQSARTVLQALGVRNFHHRIISCPTCGRCEVNLIKVVNQLQQALADRPLAGRAPLKVAVMGCVVNGPGESREADIGIAFGKKEGLLFKKGKPIRKIPVDNCVKVLLREMDL